MCGRRSESTLVHYFYSTRLLTGLSLLVANFIILCVCVCAMAFLGQNPPICDPPLYIVDSFITELISYNSVYSKDLGFPGSAKHSIVAFGLWTGSSTFFV